MANSIALNSIAGVSVASVPIVGDTAFVLATLFQYSPGSYTFRPSKAGFWQFVLWGGGGLSPGSSSQAGGSGALAIITVFLNIAQTVAVTCGGSQANSSIALPDGRVVTAGGGFQDGTPGSATGGDINLSGASAAGGLDDGPAAPSYGEFRGGASAPSGGNSGGVSPGGGAGAPTAVGNAPGGSGLVIVSFVRN